MSIQEPSPHDIKLMEKAIEEAQQAINHGKAGVGAVLSLNGEVVAIGHNEFQETKDPINHAEIVVLHRAADRLKQLSDEEVSVIIDEIITNVGASSAKDMGKVMGQVMQRLKGQADGKKVQELVKAKLGS